MSEDRRDASDSPIDRSPADSPRASDAVAERAERERTFTRRALVQAGWVIPAVVVVGIPGIAHAASGGSTNHADSSVHSDTPAPHGDVAHADAGPIAHTDAAPHTDVLHVDVNQPVHTDLVAGGVVHVDINFPPVHIDTSHTDQGGSHTDLAGTPHTDTAHTDTPNAHGDSATHGDT